MSSTHLLQCGQARVARDMLWLVMICLVSSLFVESACAQQLPESVVDVRVEGNETIDSSVILRKIQTQPGRPLSSRQLREDLRSLRATRWFFGVEERFQETANGTVLIFEVRERPIVRRVEFLGNDKVKDKLIASWTGLKVGSPFDHRANQDAVHRIEQEYREKGYFFVKVSLQRGDQPEDRDVIFRINEGPKVRVVERVIQGNNFVSAARLKTKLESKAAILRMIGGLYRPESLPLDVAALKQYYFGLGFFDVEVDAEPLFSRDRARVRLSYRIKEGTRFRVREVVLQGNNVLTAAELRRDAQLKAGDYFNSLPLSNDVRDMLTMYGERGHYFARVVPVPRYTEEPGIVDLVFEIDEDRVRYVRNFNVAFQSDHPHTKETVILDRLQVEPGDLADPYMIRRGQSRVNGGGLFEGVQVNVVPVDPETMHYASSGQTFRGQNPLFETVREPDWLELSKLVPSAQQSSPRISYGHVFPSR